MAPASMNSTKSQLVFSELLLCLTEDGGQNEQAPQDFEHESEETTIEEHGAGRNSEWERIATATGKIPS